MRPETFASLVSSLPWSSCSLASQCVLGQTTVQARPHKQPRPRSNARQAGLDDRRGLCSILTGLKEIERRIENGEFVWRADREDVHMNVEAALIDLVGELAKKLHTTRSRNDQVVTDVRLWCRDPIDQILGRINLLQRPPRKDMEDAWVYYNSRQLWFQVQYPNDSGPAAVYSYFQEVDGNASASNLRSMNYYVNGICINSFTIDLVDPYEVGGCVFTIYDTTMISISITNTSELPPILNAFEIYYVYSWNGIATATEDVKSIQGIQNEVNLTDWTGDPCVPVPYDWLSCSILDNQAASNQLVAPENACTHIKRRVGPDDRCGLCLQSMGMCWRLL